MRSVYYSEVDLEKICLSDNIEQKTSKPSAESPQGISYNSCNVLYSYPDGARGPFLIELPKISSRISKNKFGHHGTMISENTDKEQEIINLIGGVMNQIKYLCAQNAEKFKDSGWKKVFEKITRTGDASDIEYIDLKNLIKVDEKTGKHMFYIKTRETTKFQVPDIDPVTNQCKKDDQGNIKMKIIGQNGNIIPKDNGLSYVLGKQCDLTIFLRIAAVFRGAQKCITNWIDAATVYKIAPISQTITSVRARESDFDFESLLNPVAETKDENRGIQDPNSALESDETKSEDSRIDQMNTSFGKVSLEDLTQGKTLKIGTSSGTRGNLFQKFDNAQNA